MRIIKKSKNLETFWIFTLVLSILTIIIFWKPSIELIVITACIYITYIVYLYSNFHNRKIIIDNNKMILTNKKGQYIGQINLEQIYNVDYLYRSHSWAIYKVEQNNIVLRFSSRN